MKVRAGQTYTYHPVVLDMLHPATGGRVEPLKDGERVVVVNLPGAPKANTMGQCHVERLDGSFYGMVSTNSLHKE
jgi:hypothetical protein